MVTADDSRITQVERFVAAIDLPIGRWDRQARLVYCNDHYTTWVGKSRHEMLGLSLTELFGDAAWAHAAPAFAQAFEGRTMRYERQLAHGPAPGRWLLIHVFPDADAAGTVDAVFTLATDIHDDVVAREALLATQRRLDRFTENIPYPLTYVDGDFVIRFVNKAYTEAIRARPGMLIGRHMSEARGARRWAEHGPFFRRALEGRTVQYTRLVSALPQGPRWMRTSYVPDLDADGEVLGVYTVTIDVHDLTMTQEKLKRRVERDALTDVLSRRTMMDRIEAALADARHRSLALYFIDLDGFKAINDALGHREGDALLVAVAAALQKAVRADDAVGRFGGDEFLVLADVHDAAGAHALARHMVEAVGALATASHGAAGVSASIGYALAPSDSNHPLSLLQLADEAMYAAKRLGKNGALHCASIAAEISR